MNRTELDALLAEKAPAPLSRETLQTSYDYLISLQTAQKVDLDELKAKLDALGLLKELVDESSSCLIGAALQAIVDRADFPEKLRGRVESFKRVIWGLVSDTDPVHAEFVKQLAALDVAETRNAAVRWLNDHRDLLPEAPPAKLTLATDVPPAPSPTVPVR